MRISDILFRVSSFLNYQYEAKTKYYIHSPFVYKFFLKVLHGKETDDTKSIVTFRKEIKRTHRMVSYADPAKNSFSEKTIKQLETKVSVSHHHGKFLYHLARFSDPQIILELGGGIGISTAYLAVGNPGAKVFSMDGSPQLQEEAKLNHKKLGIKNISYLPGNFDDILTESLIQIGSPDLVFIDGNHCYQSTWSYFNILVNHVNEKTILVFDDIHYSKEMNKAWSAIKSDSRVGLTIELYRMGLCFFAKERIVKENFVLRY